MFQNIVWSRFLTQGVSCSVRANRLSEGKKKSQFISFAYFCGINTMTKANSKLPVHPRWMELGRDAGDWQWPRVDLLMERALTLSIGQKSLLAKPMPSKQHLHFKINPSTPPKSNCIYLEEKAYIDSVDRFTPNPSQWFPGVGEGVGRGWGRGEDAGVFSVAL